MATNAAKIAGASECLLKIGKTETPLSAGIGEKMLKASKFRDVMDQAKASMEAVHEELEKEITAFLEVGDAATAHICYRGVKLTISRRESVEIEDADGLRKAIEKAGSRWDDLVKTVVTYKPMESLIRLVETSPKLGKFLGRKVGKTQFKYAKE